MTHSNTDFDVIVVGGGPSGATAAHEIALAGHSVLLLERASNKALVALFHRAY